MISTDLAKPNSSLGKQARFEFRFPSVEEGLDQDEAWFEVKIDGQWQRFRLHDYDEIYKVPGLYECLFYRTFRCNSPQTVVGQLTDVMRDARQPAEDLRVFDMGAGNGMVGSELQNAGVSHIIGADIIPEGKTSAERDRPWAYDGYYVCDLTDLDEKTEQQIREFKPNALTTVAALGFGDIPDAAFLKSLDLIETPAWLAFNIKEDFVQETDHSGFSDLISELKQRGILQVQAYRRYCHRLSFAGEPLYYIAMVALKMKHVPDDLFEKAKAADQP